jgi:hypothetical protein
LILHLLQRQPRLPVVQESRCFLVVPVAVVVVAAAGVGPADTGAAEPVAEPEGATVVAAAVVVVDADNGDEKEEGVPLQEIH